MTTESVTVALSALRNGRLVIVPTETFYGLAADAFNPRALRRVFKTKGRERRKPLLVLIGKQSDSARLARQISPSARRFMRAFWPGPLTIVFPAKPSLPKELTAGTGTIAIRFTSHPLTQRLAKRFGPITGTSANRSGKPAQRTVAGVLRHLGSSADIAIALNGGTTRGGRPSTIIDVTQHPPHIIREGAVSRHRIAKVSAIT